MAGAQAAEAAMSAVGAKATTPPPPPEPVAPPAAAPPKPAAPSGPGVGERASKLAKRLSASWIVRYVVVFLLVVAVLALIRPTFVLRHPLPSPDDPDNPEKLSIQRLGIAAAVAVAAAVVAPLIYQHRSAIASGFGSATKSVKSVLGK